MSPAHARGQRRWAVVGLVAAVVIGGAVLARSRPTPLPGGPALSPAAQVEPQNAESSAWYCTSQSVPPGPSVKGVLILTNTATSVVQGTISTISDAGATAVAALAVPARGQVVATIPAPASGSWMSERVELAGGGVSVSQAVDGPTGWSEAPCQSTTSQQWYFPSGTTSGSNGMYIALLNPTSTPDVVDLSFVTPAGLAHPINFQGLVLAPGQTEVEDVGAFVQNQPTVSTIVASRTGRMVASEVEFFTGSGSGLSIVPGNPRPEPHWTVPLSLELAGATSALDIFNPGSTPEHVTVRARLTSGPLQPLVETVAPDSTWNLATSAQTRIPVGGAYSSVIDATGGPGVVVSRIIDAPAAAQMPQAGIANAIDAESQDMPTHTWLLPSPGSTSNPVITGVLPAHVALFNPTGKAETYVVSVFTPKGTRQILSATLPPSAFVSLSGSKLFGAGLNPLLVQSDGPLSVSEDVGPSAAYGVVTMPGIPLAPG
jgi:hypothetical protein